MDDKREAQQELFEEFTKQAGSKRRMLRPDAAKRLHTIILSNEQLIFVFISIVILLVVFFSLGVERGKRIALIEKKPLSLPKEIVVGEEGAVKQGPVKQQVPAKIKSSVVQQAPKTGTYIIQVASYADEKLAEKEKNFLSVKGYNAEAVKSGKLFTINIVGFSTKEEAENFTVKIKDRYKDYIIKKKK